MSIVTAKAQTTRHRILGINKKRSSFFYSKLLSPLQNLKSVIFNRCDKHVEFGGNGATAIL